VKSDRARAALAPVLAALGAAVIVTAPGAAPPSDQSKKQKPASHTVTIDASAFDPADLTVAAGDTVVWVNKDFFAHTATSKSGGFDSDDIPAAKSWTYLTKKKGDFPYVCSIHPSMKGTLHVK
jgi:plastocyanin